MDIITTLKSRLECKINFTLPALLPNKFNMTMQGPATSSENIQSKRAIPALAIIQGSYRWNDDQRCKCTSRCQESIIF